MTRVRSFQAKLKEKNIGAFLVSDLKDICYLTGFTGTAAYMIVTPTDAVFYTDGRYEEQSKQQVGTKAQRVVIPRYSNLFKEECPKYKNLVLQKKCELGIAQSIEESGCSVTVDKNDLLLVSRMIKSDDEIALIKEQYNIAGAAFNKSLPSFISGTSEKSWAAFLEYNMKTAGAIGESFETIIASGERGAMPHGVASDKIIQKGEPVILDFGSRNQYTSDYTRMLYSGNDKDVLDVIDIVRSAMLKAFENVRSGVKCAEIDSIARDYISSKGFGKYFNHSLGHGVGLDVHELPVLNSISQDIIQDGMVFTIEPGIYLPGKFGVRLEETVLIKNGRGEMISRFIDKYVYDFE